MPKKKPRLPKEMTVDERLAEHLSQAEIHLIAAVELFAKKVHPDRPIGYIERLTRAQETVTSLMREELVRIRGPIRVKTSIVKSRRSK